MKPRAQPQAFKDPESWRTPGGKCARVVNSLRVTVRRLRRASAGRKAKIDVDEPPPAVMALPGNVGRRAGDKQGKEAGTGMRSANRFSSGRAAIGLAVCAIALAVTVPVALGHGTAGRPVTNYLTYVGGKAGKAK